MGIIGESKFPQNLIFLTEFCFFFLDRNLLNCQVQYNIGDMKGCHGPQIRTIFNTMKMVALIEEMFDRGETEKRENWNNYPQ